MPDRRHLEEPEAGLQGPDYVTLVIEWDSLAEEMEHGIAAASSEPMPTKDSDWAIDQAGLESFPASDPPSWGSSHAAPSAHTVTEPLATNKRGNRIPIVLGVLALFSLTGLLAGRAWLRDR